jgi:hypothetical protein
MADEPESNQPVAPSDTPEPPSAEPHPPAAPPTGWLQPDPPAPPAALPSGWQPPDWLIAAPVPPDPPRTAATRTIEAIAWVVGGIAVLFFGRTLVLFNADASFSGFERGELVGYMVGAVLLGALFRWIFVRLRKRGRVLSPWVLVVATVVLAAHGFSLPSSASTIAAQPISTYLKIGAPYNLVTADADTVSQLANGFKDEGATETEVREITQGTETVGFLVIANVDATDSDVFRAGVESGFEKTEGAEAHEDIIGSRKVVVGTVSGVVAVFWAEEPYGLIVYAFDVDSGKALAGSVMDAYR